MSRCEQLTVFLGLLFAVLFPLATSDIYKSVFWTTNNPLFLNSTGLSPCYGEDLEIRVHLMSSLPVVCPFEFIIMQTLRNRPATSVLYENFWIVYDEESFKNCDVNMTYRGPNDEKNEKLHDCDTPDTLKSFAYSIDFKIRSPVNTGTAFVGGRYYYFLATSDGTHGSLNNTKGGHCNDPNIRMKFKVYVCKENDVNCQNVPIGEFLCPNGIPAATISPSTTTEVFSTSSTESSTTAIQTESSTIADTTSSETNETNGPIIKGKLNSNQSCDKLSNWRAVAVIFISLFVPLLIGIFYYCAQRHKDKPACFNDMNKVTPPGPSRASNDINYLLPKTNVSYTNSNYSEDYEDGKNTSTFKTQINKQPTAPADKVIGNTPEQCYSPNGPHEKNSGVDCEVVVVPNDPSTFGPQIKKEPTAPAEKVIESTVENCRYSPKRPNQPNF